jgi:hypothetical protein
MGPLPRLLLILLVLGMATGVLAQNQERGGARVLSLLETLPPEGASNLLQWRSAHPNPFSSTTLLRFTLPDGAMARLRIFDLMGGLRAQLPLVWLERGIMQVQLNATGWPSGVYLASLDYKGQRQVRKLILAR